MADFMARQRGHAADDDSSIGDFWGIISEYFSAGLIIFDAGG